MNYKMKRSKKTLLLIAVISSALIPWQGYYLLLKTIIPIAILVTYYRLNRFTLKVLGLSRPSAKTLGLGGVLGVMISLFSTVIVRPLVSVFAEQRDVSQFDFIVGNPFMLVVALAFTWIFAAFAEEFIWRGYVLRNFLSFLDNAKGQVIFSVLGSSLIFALLHSYQGIGGVLQVFTISIVYCMVYLQFNQGLWVCILSHGIGNTISFLLIYLDLYEYRNAINWF